MKKADVDLTKLERAELLVGLSDTVAGPVNTPDERTRALVAKSTQLVCTGQVDPREDIERCLKLQAGARYYFVLLPLSTGQELKITSKNASLSRAACRERANASFRVDEVKLLLAGSAEALALRERVTAAVKADPNFRLAPISAPSAPAPLFGTAAL